jgi:Flp pilus assembly protein TadG
MRAPRNQRGITLVLIAIAMLALIAIAGLALDVGHLVENQAQLQATVDAAAISAAKSLDDTTSTPLATAAALNVFATNAAQDTDLAAAGVTPTIEFSSTANPFAAGSAPAQYVQVDATGVGIPAMLSSALGFNVFNLSAHAVAGPSPTLSNACNVTPLMMCGTAPAPATPVYGYYVGQIIALQLSSGTPQATLGNYLTLSSGVNSEDQDFAGGYANCSAVGTSDSTGTGTVPVLVAEGLDTRFDEYLAGDVSSAAYPPDVITTQPPIGDPNRLQCTDATCQTIVNGAGTVITNSSQDPTYSYEGMYLPSVLAGNYNFPPAPGGIGVFNRRVLAVPVGDCTQSTPAGGPVPVLGFACIFTLQDVDATGDPTTGQVFGEVLQSCQVNGTPGPTPNNAPGAYSIQLYHVAGSPQS